MTSGKLNTLLIMVSGIVLAGCAQNPQSQSSTANVQASAFTKNNSATCNGQPLDTRFDRPVLRNGFDNQLFDIAVLHYTNERRCANGVPPLAGDPGLQQAAGLHSEDMATRRFFSHTSPVPGRETLRDRLRGQGVKIRSAAENIATRPRLQIAGGQPFFIIDRQNCNFSLEGKPVQPHTYNTLAQSFVMQWENSPGHRKNLFNPKFTRLGSGGGVQSNPEVCGDIVATQNFAS